MKKIKAAIKHFTNEYIENLKELYDLERLKELLNYKNDYIELLKDYENNFLGYPDLGLEYKTANLVEYGNLFYVVELFFYSNILPLVVNDLGDDLDKAQYDVWAFGGI